MKRISIIGLGYVGLPLAVEFGKKYDVLGFDIDKKRIAELKKGNDKTREITREELKKATKLNFIHDVKLIEKADIHIITVPTPINHTKLPDLSSIKLASKTIGSILKKGDIVVYESTVFPGCTEEECVPILEKESGLKFNVDFFCGYSPERINPSDRVHTLPNIKKVISGSTPEATKEIDELYKSIILAGTYVTSSIKVAEAAKVIENSQRDLNIAFVNELSLIFDKLNIDTSEVLDTAATKWNFLPFKPGLVGGHCIGVDSYYLTYKAKSVGYNPEIILAGRKINDGMGEVISNQVVKLMTHKNIPVKGSDCLILGITFKENCPDIRNSKVIDLVNHLSSFGLNIDVYDPNADIKDVKHEYGIDLVPELNKKRYHSIVLAVSHKEFLNIDFKEISHDVSVLYDVKGFLDKSLIDKRL